MRTTTSTASFTTTSKRSIIRRPLTAALLVTVALGVATAALSQATDPASRLEELEKATSLRQDGIKPWEMKLSFVLSDMKGKPEDEGKIDVKWVGLRKEEAEVESKFVHGKLISVDSDDQKIAREKYLIEELISETVNPVSSRYPRTDFNVNQHDQKFGDTILTCLTVFLKRRPDAGSALSTVYCVEPERPTSLRAKQEGQRGVLRNRLGKFQDVSLALDNKIVFEGLPAITGHIDSIVVLKDEPSAPIAEAVIAPDLSVGVSGGVSGGERISGQQPEYPQVARDAHVGGTVIIAAVIDKSGHIVHVVPVASPYGALTIAAVDAVKSYRYKPFLLNGIPTEVRTIISVNFDMR